LPDSSIDCSPCRLEWRPSRWPAVAAQVLWPLGALALLSTSWLAGLPPAASLLASAVAVGIGRWRAVVIRRTPAATLALHPGGRACWVREGFAIADGAAVAHEQWPVTTVRFRDCGTTVVFWPDTLCDSSRRDLRRWARSASSASPLPQFWMG
jgi:toxin CptA